MPLNFFLLSIVFFFSFFISIYLFLERGEEKEKERKRNIHVWLPPMHPPLGTQPTTQACAPTGNWTSNPLGCRPELNPLSHTSQGFFFFKSVLERDVFNKKKKWCLWSNRVIWGFKFYVQKPHPVSYVDNDVGHYLKTLKHSGRFFYYWEVWELPTRNP